jgi:hypothetical protein
MVADLEDEEVLKEVLLEESQTDALLIVQIDPAEILAEVLAVSVEDEKKVRKRINSFIKPHQLVRLSIFNLLRNVNLRV